jgi:CBS domain-containing protein
MGGNSLTFWGKSAVPARPVQTADVMALDPLFCLRELPLFEAAELMRAGHRGETMVVNNDTDIVPIGIITDWDIVMRCLAQGRNPLTEAIEAFMSTPVFAVLVDTPLIACRKIMMDNQIHRVPVVERSGRLCGLVSRADVTWNLAWEG